MSDLTAQRSRELFQSGFFCAESVLMSIAENQGIHSELIPKIATGFCSGISRTSNMCGAISGAIMAINLVAGRNIPSESNEKCYSLVQKLIDEFENKFGAVNCSELIDCDLATEEGQRFFMEQNLMEQCYLFAEGATHIALSLITELTSNQEH